jgi:hypothetical protein
VTEAGEEAADPDRLLDREVGGKGVDPLLTGRRGSS